MTSDQLIQLRVKVVNDSKFYVDKVREIRSTNKGKWVDKYLAFVNLAPGFPWCVAFAIFRVHKAAKALGLKSILPRIASSSKLYNWFKLNHILLDIPESGCIGMLKNRKKYTWKHHTHTFIVTRVYRRKVSGLLMIEGVDGNWKNKVSLTTRPAHTCDYGMII